MDVAVRMIVHMRMNGIFRIIRVAVSRNIRMRIVFKFYMEPFCQERTVHKRRDADLVSVNPELIYGLQEFCFVCAKIEEGDGIFVEGHGVHLSLLQQDAAGVGSTNVPLLLVHSEDQLMQAESFRILANEFIDLYEKVLG